MADVADSQDVADDTVAIAVEALDVGLDVVKDHGALQLGALVGVEADVVGVLVGKVRAAISSSPVVLLEG